METSSGWPGFVRVPTHLKDMRDLLGADGERRQLDLQRAEMEERQRALRRVYGRRRP